MTYKTAWRMGQQIRTLMAKADGFEKLKGHVEIDEAYVGGYRRGVVAGRRTRRLFLAFRARWPYDHASYSQHSKRERSAIVLENVERGARFRPMN